MLVLSSHDHWLVRLIVTKLCRETLQSFIVKVSLRRLWHCYLWHCSLNIWINHKVNRIATVALMKQNNVLMNLFIFLRVLNTLYNYEMYIIRHNARLKIWWTCYQRLSYKLSCSWFVFIQIITRLFSFNNNLCEVQCLGVSLVYNTLHDCSRYLHLQISKAYIEYFPCLSFLVWFFFKSARVWLCVYVRVLLCVCKNARAHASIYQCS